MTKPLVVSIPHHLGREEAVRRLQTGMGRVREKFGHLLRIEEESWAGDAMTFRASALGQSVSGTIAVAEDHARIEVRLPCLLARIAEQAQKLIRKEGVQMLEDKKKR